MKNIIVFVIAIIIGFSFSNSLAEYEKGEIIYDSLRFRMGNYTYEAPASWDVNEQILDTRHHTFYDDIFYSVALVVSPDGGDFADNYAVMESMMNSIIKSPVCSAVALDCGQTGYIAVGESSVTEGKIIYALYVMNSPGFLQIVYSNLNTTSTEEEFELLISTLSLAVQETKENSSDHKYISKGDVGYPVEKLLLKIGYFDVSYTNSKDPEPYMDEAAQAALIHFQSNSGLEATGIFDPDTICLATGCLMPDSDDLVWIPMHGGRRYHRYEGCSDMIEPREMPARCAIALGFGPCGRCY